jgi:hypothetical protein
MDTNYLNELAKMKRPLPGSSLTSDPTKPAAYEKAPEFVVVREALDYLFVTLTTERNYMQLLMSLSEGATVMDTTRLLLFTGFTEGKWNPDLLLLLIEPVAYMIMALAERADIEIIIDNDDETNPDEELSIGQNKLKEIQKRNMVPKLPADIVPAEIQKKIEKLPVPQVSSLMQRQG